MKSIQKISYGIILMTTIFAACSDSSENPNPSGNGGGNGNPEGIYEGVWVMSNEDMPTDDLKAAYQEVRLETDADENYTYTWTKTNGSKTVFKGITTMQKTSKKYDSGAAIWRYSIWVSTINGREAPGGWDGLYSYDDPNTLVMNVEPRVDGWSKWPTPEGGIGSGANGQKSVFVFRKQ